MISRSSAPQSLKRVGRQASRSLGRMTAHVRLEPSFLVVGAQRCGTTSLFRALAEHPAVVTPLFHKGVHYFDVNHHRGFDWYRGHFPLRVTAQRRAAGLGCEPVTGESSPYYLHHPLAPGRIAAELPQAKLIVLVRDPVERAWSAHKHEAARGFEDRPFEQALELEPQRLRGEVDRMRNDPSYQSHSHRHHGYVTRGRYAEQIKVLHEYVDREQVLVVQSENFFLDPEPVYHRVLKFLGLPFWAPPRFEQHNARPSAAMAGSTRQQLSEHFASHDAMLAEILGEAPVWRRP